MGVMAKEPQGKGINAVADDAWVQIDVTVDSGATETVMAESTLSGVIDITDEGSLQERRHLRGGERRGDS